MTPATARISTPRVYLVRMVVFLSLAGFVALVLQRPIAGAFMANPGLNALIVGALAVGIGLSFRQVWRLRREARFANRLRDGEPADPRRPPRLLAPVASLIGERAGRAVISTATLRSVLDAVGMRLDEAREISRYLTGLLVFLGLLGTFWGLLETVSSVGGVITSMRGGGEAGAMFEELKAGLAAPLAGMGISFSSSLFGLAGSLVLGFLDLQAGQAAGRFYTELEDWLSASVVDAGSLEAARGLAGAAGGGLNGADPRASIAQLAEGIQALVGHMRAEQQLIRDWAEGQAEQGRDVKRLLERALGERAALPAAAAAFAPERGASPERGSLPERAPFDPPREAPRASGLL